MHQLDQINPNKLWIFILWMSFPLSMSFRSFASVCDLQDWFRCGFTSIAPPDPKLLSRLGTRTQKHPCGYNTSSKSMEKNLTSQKYTWWSHLLQTKMSLKRKKASKVYVFVYFIGCKCMKATSSTHLADETVYCPLLCASLGWNLLSWRGWCWFHFLPWVQTWTLWSGCCSLTSYRANQQVLWHPETEFQTGQILF